MRSSRTPLGALVLLVFFFASGDVGYASSLTVLYTFEGGSDGGNPLGNLISGVELRAFAGFGNNASSPVISDGMLHIGLEGAPGKDLNLYALALAGGKNAVYHRNSRPPSPVKLHRNHRLKIRL